MSAGSLTPGLEETLTVFEQRGEPRGTAEVADALGLGRRSAYDRLERLVDHDVLDTKKVGSSARVWWRPTAETDARLERLVRRVPGMVYRCRDEPGRPMSFVSEAAADVTGYDPAAIESGRVSWDEDVIHPDDRESVRAEVHGQLAASEEFTVEYRIVTADGETRWVRERGCAVEGDGDTLEGTVTDATGQVESERDRARANEQFRSLVDATREYAIFMLDPEGCVRTWNEGGERIKGYDREAIVGEHFSTFYTDEDRRARVPERNLATAARAGSVEDEGWRVRADGSRFWARVTITAIRDEDGHLEGFAKVTRDMTDRRRYEQRLREERDVSRQVLETAPASISVVDRAGEVVRANDRFREYVGVADVVGDLAVDDLPVYDPAGERVPPDERPHRTVFETGEPVTDWQCQFDVSGDRRWVSLNAAPVTGADGTVERVVVTAQDITQIKRQQRELERRRDELEAELTAVFERVDDAFLTLDDQWRFTHLNEQAEQLLDRSAGELLGQSVWDAFPEATGTQFQREYERAFETQESVSFEARYGPLETWLEVRAYPSESGLSVYFRDVTERVEREHELEQYEAVFETVEDGIYALDDEGRVVLANEAFADMVGADRAAVLGTAASEFYDDVYVPIVAERAAAVQEGERDVATIEFELRRTDGDTVPVETRYRPFEYGDGHGRCGVVRDVSERIERERQLQQRVRQQEVVTDLGRRALGDGDLDTLFAQAARRVAATLDTDYCKVLDLDPEAERLLLRQGVGWDEGIVGSATVSAAADDSQAAYTLRTDDPVVVEDLASEERFSGPDLLTDHDVHSGVSTVIGPSEDPWGILGTHDTEARSFSTHDVNFVQSVANILASAIEHHDHERELVRQRELLAALNNLNRVVREITDAVIDQSTRAEIEQTVCDLLADSESYLFAWVGDVNPANQRVQVRAEAGVEGYLDDTTVSVAPDDEHSQGPTGRAFRTGEVQTVRNVFEDPEYEPWRDRAHSYGFQSSVAVPVVSGDTLYGVLNVYAGRPEAFDGQERDVIAQLGEVVGHAIAATERKQALTSDELVELEFYVPDVFEVLGIEADTGGTVTLDHTVSVGSGEHLVYGTATPEAVDTVAAFTDHLPHWETVTVRDDEGTRGFEARLSEQPVLSAIASVGGAVEEVVIEDGDCRMTVHVPPSVDVRRIIDTVEDSYPTVQLLRRQQITRDEGPFERVERVLTADLTDRQRAALEAAYRAGFFEWPRDASGEDVAESLDIAAPTFHQHLRKAERKVFDQFFDGPLPARR
jgi:PAS domain S-box-containing protein